jgi:sec-independent protein translocase protein TatC
VTIIRHTDDKLSRQGQRGQLRDRVLPRRLGRGEEISTVEHLSELRRRLVVSLLSVCGAFAVTYSLRSYLIDWLNRPLHGREPITFGVAEPFMTSVKVALYAALALALPVLLWQLWSFVAPAVEEGVRTTVARLVGVATLLFAGGVAFAYFVVLPAAIRFLLGFDDRFYEIQVRAREYYSFATVTIFVVGLLFELPVFILTLVRLGILTAEGLRRNRRIGIAACAVTAVLLPGVDPLTTALQAAPLLALFEGSIWAAVFFEKRWNVVPEPTLSSASETARRS